MKINDIHNYLSETKKHFETQCDLEGLDESIKRQFSIQIEAINNLNGWLLWKEKNSTEKQSARISSLATMRKIDALESIILKQEWAIEFYELFSETLPYVKVISDGRNNVLQPLVMFCNSYIEKIDFSSTYRKEIPRETEVKEAFECYYNSIQNKSASFKECYIKIEALYEKLIISTL